MATVYRVFASGGHERVIIPALQRVTPERLRRVVRELAACVHARGAVGVLVVGRVARLQHVVAVRIASIAAHGISVDGGVWAV